MEGTLETTPDGRYTLRFERRMAQPVDTVWQAITDPDALRAWFPQRVDLDLRVGGKMRFSHEASEATFDGEILELDPPRLLAYTWGTDLLRWELRPDGDGCVLTFTDTFAEGGKAARDGAGWHVCLEALVASLDGTTPPASDRWAELNARYVASFGPEAATIGPPGG